MADEALGFEWDELGEVERQETILETLEAIFSRVDTHIELTARQDASSPYVVERVMQSCLAGVDMLYTGREDTCVDAIAFYQNSWEVDLEPMPAPLDVWARGAVITRVPPKMPTLDRKSGTSISSRASATSRAPGRSAAPPSELGQVQETKSPRSRMGSKTSTATGAGTSPSKRPAKPKLSKEDQAREDRLREEISIRRRQEEIKKEMERSRERARAELSAMQQALKGKEYSYDHKGEVVVSAKVDPARLPQMLPMPKTQIHNEYVPPESNPASRQGSRGPSRDKDKAPAAASNRRTSTAATDTSTKKENPMPPYIEHPNEGQPPPTDTIKPNAGVTLTMGKTVKKGSERQTSSMKEMSKKEFTEYITKKGHFEKLPDSAAFQAAQTQLREAEQEAFLRRQAEIAAAESKAAASGKPRNQMPRSTEDEVGPMGLGVPAHRPPEWLQEGIPVKKTVPKPPPKKGDINKMLLSAPDWGSARPRRKDGDESPESKSPSPTRPEKKPSVSHRERTVGKVSRRPRDRQFGYITERDLQEYQ